MTHDDTFDGGHGRGHREGRGESCGDVSPRSKSTHSRRARVQRSQPSKGPELAETERPSATTFPLRPVARPIASDVERPRRRKRRRAPAHTRVDVLSVARAHAAALRVGMTAERSRARRHASRAYDTMSSTHSSRAECSWASRRDSLDFERACGGDSRLLASLQRPEPLGRSADPGRSCSRARREWRLKSAHSSARTRSCSCPLVCCLS